MLSVESRTAAMPPCAQSLAPSRKVRLEMTAIFLFSAKCRATDRPARPLPTMATSKFMLLGFLLDKYDKSCALAKTICDLCKSRIKSC